MRKGYAVQVLSNLENATTDEARAFDAQHGLSVVRANRNEGPIQWLRIKLAWAALKKHPHTHVLLSGKFSLWTGALLGLFFRKAHFIPIIHGSEINLKQRIPAALTRWALSRFTRIICVSHFTRDLISPKRKHQQFSVIPNAIDTAYLQQFLSLEPMPLIGTPSLLTVGNVSYRKGQLNVVRALPTLLKSFPKLHYHCVGLPGKADEIMQVARELGVEQHITFHGKLPEKALMAAYRGCDVFIMLSEIVASGDFEGFGIAILEANFFGKPAIGSCDCGIEDAIDQHKTGVKVPFHDAHAITEALAFILANNNMAVAAKAWSMQHDWDKVVESYLPFLPE